MRGFEGVLKKDPNGNNMSSYGITQIKLFQNVYGISKSDCSVNRESESSLNLMWTMEWVDIPSVNDAKNEFNNYQDKFKQYHQTHK
jgi:hypothetical protein